jgi:hypothetical protein
VTPAKSKAAKAQTPGAKAAGSQTPGMHLTVDPAQLALPPRPAPPPDVMAAITAAAQLLWPQPGAPDAQDPIHESWRFSGRWWSQPAQLRRARPWARP